MTWAMWVLCLLLLAVLPGAWFWHRLFPQASATVCVGLGSGVGVLALTWSYLVGRSLGTPWASAVPLVVAAVSAVAHWLRARGRSGRGNAEAVNGIRRTPVLVIVGAALLAAWPLVYFSQRIWPALPLTDAGLRAPFVDESYHVALIGELRHHFPGTFPYVDGTPLAYHWLSQAFTAAMTWPSAVAPVEAYRFLLAPTSAVLALMGLVALALTRGTRPLPLLLASAVFVAGSPPDLLPGSDLATPVTGYAMSLPIMTLAPGLTFGYVLLMPTMALLFGAIGRDSGVGRYGPVHWVTLGALLFSLGGAKAVLLPLIIAGLGFALVITRAWRTLAGPLALTLLAFGASTSFFYGGSSRSLSLAPLAYPNWLAENNPGMSAGAVALSIVCGVLLVVGPLALPSRDAPAHLRAARLLTLGGAIAGMGIVLLAGHAGMSQDQFLMAGLALGAIGLASSASSMQRPARLWLVTAAVLCLIAPAVEASRVARGDGPLPLSSGYAVGPGAAEATQWLREHTSPGEVVATNVHCFGPEPTTGCARTAFWLTAHAERRFLVEGWSFVPPEVVGQESTPETNGIHGPFWDPALLATNDRLFTNPQADDLSRTKSEHGVTHLIASRRYPMDETALRAVATPVAEFGDYLILAVP